MLVLENNKTINLLMNPEQFATFTSERLDVTKDIKYDNIFDKMING